VSKSMISYITSDRYFPFVMTGNESKWSSSGIDSAC
jgi:hypothetical protein